MKIKVAWFGKTKDAAIESLTAEYLKRISRYAQIETTSLKDETAVLNLCKARPTRPTLILLDAKGKQFTSEEFAKFLDGYKTRSSQPLLFAVGPADGFSAAAHEAAAHTISFGKMTLSHELARIVLLEQLYRAFTILQGHPYHLGHR